MAAVRLSDYNVRINVRQLDEPAAARDLLTASVADLTKAKDQAAKNAATAQTEAKRIQAESTTRIADLEKQVKDLEGLVARLQEEMAAKEKPEPKESETP